MATPTALPASFTAGDVLTASNMNLLRGAFRILQVVSAIKTDAFSTTSTSYVDITGLSVSITPTSSSSNVLVIMQGLASQSTGNMQLNLVRDSTNIAQSTGASSANQTLIFGTSATSEIMGLGVTFLDSPATTSATTYKMQMKVNTSTGYINRRVLDDALRGVSTITAFEVSA